MDLEQKNGDMNLCLKEKSIKEKCALPYLKLQG